MSITAEPFKAYFEVSWEIANKVGGIYTVIKTKSAVEAAAFEELGEPYYLIGPLNRKSFDLEVEETEPSLSIVTETMDTLKGQGVGVVHGRWLIEGHPSVILLDVGSAYWKLTGWRAEFWELTHIGIPDTDSEAKDALVFGFLCAWFVSEFTSRLPGVPTVSALFHEWQGGVGGLLLRLWDKPVAVNFHTHATLIGQFPSCKMGRKECVVQISTFPQSVDKHFVESPSSLIPNRMNCSEVEYPSSIYRPLPVCGERGLLQQPAALQRGPGGGGPRDLPPLLSGARLCHFRPRLLYRVTEHRRRMRTPSQEKARRHLSERTQCEG